MSCVAMDLRPILDKVKFGYDKLMPEESDTFIPDKPIGNYFPMTITSELNSDE
jgi:hypothetical protein